MPFSHNPLTTTAEAPPAETGHVGRIRWTICALLFAATTINYMDRQVLGILAPDLQKSLRWNEQQYGNIVASFQAAYAIGLLAFGRIMDKIGTRKGLSGAVVFWSMASVGHALAHSAFGFGVARFALGLSEAGNFPAAIKTVAEWFPKKERALATGIFNSGSNIGAILAPIAVPFIALTYGWRWAFIAIGMLGFVWLGFWLRFYRRPEDHPRLTERERAHILSDRELPTVPIPWARLVPKRQTWAFAAGKFLTDPVWWFYLSWLPKFLNKEYGLTLNTIGLPLIVVYVMADVGSIGGGWISSRLIAGGMDVNRARKTAMLICALCVTPIFWASQASHVWVAVGLIGLAAAAHQGWSANLYTLVSDTFPRKAVGSVVGIGSMVGAFAGMFVASAVGFFLQRTGGNYVPLFAVASMAYLVALLLIHVINPHLSPARFAEDGEQTSGL